MLKIVKIDDAYFAEEEGQEAVECTVITEKKGEKVSYWIKLPKGNSTNRQFVSVKSFEEKAIDNEIIVPVKTSGPRIVGGPKKAVIDYLDAEDAEVYTSIVEKAMEAYKNSKSARTKKPLNQMSKEELQAMLNALENDEKYSVTTGPKSFIDCMSDEDRDTYVALVEKSQENKKNRPKAPRGPLTEEQKAARKEKAKEKKRNTILAMLAQLEGEDIE